MILSTFLYEVILVYYNHITKIMTIFPKHRINCLGFITKNGKIVNTRLDKSGYETVGILIGNKRHWIQIHRAMCSSFLGRPDDDQTAVHIYRERKNNSIWNLRWYTPPQQNMNRGKMKNRATCIPVVGTHIKNGTIVEFDSIEDAIENGYFGAGKCLRGKQKTSGGYIWNTPPELPDLMWETWKLYKTYKVYDVYISNMDRVAFEFNIKTDRYRKKMYSNELTSHNGYHTFNDQLFHRVVWSVFFGEIPDDLVIHHLDANNTNNSLDNLECTTQNANNLAAHDCGSYKGTKTERQPININGVNYTSCHDAAKKLNIYHNTIRWRVDSDNFQDYVYV